MTKYDDTTPMGEVVMRRVDVLAQLRENRDNHRAVFEKAMEGYRVKAIELLEGHIKRIKAHAPERVMINLTMPEDHTADYDLAIAMLEENIMGQVILDSRDFATYIRDDWGWKKDFTTTANFYAASS